jgi:predicted O-methyltransferase YrrM
MSIDRLHGWFDFHDIYTQAVAEARADSILVEVGVAFGRSAAFLAQKLESSGNRGAKFFVVDPWSACVPQANEEATRAEEARVQIEGGPFNTFLHGMREWARPELERMLVLRAPSVQVARMFDPGSVDFVFVDGSHAYADVCADLDAWWPKIRAGGVLAGHDYCDPGIMRAVQERFGPLPYYGPNSWWTRRSKP